MKTGGVVALVVATAGLTGCAMTHGIRGVTAAQTTCGSATTTPLAAADVHVECPGQGPLHATTDGAGRFYIQLVDGLPRECVVRASKAGYHDVKRKLGDLCAHHAYEHDPSCDAASFSADLVPTTPGAAP